MTARPGRLPWVVLLGPMLVTGCTVTFDVWDIDGGMRDEGGPACGPSCDAGRDAALDASADLGTRSCGDTLGDFCLADFDCQDPCFCNGREVCAGGICAPGRPPCDDLVACTVDLCDEEGWSCRNTPDDRRCDDDDPCTELEACDPVAGCLKGFRRDCSDDSVCTIDGCTEDGACVNVPRDLDGDGFVAFACGGLDCDDDPVAGGAVFPGARERCDDGIDNNCDGLTDLVDAEACPATNDRCGSARDLPRSGTYFFSSFGLTDRYELDCEGPGSELDAVFRFDAATDRRVRARLNAVGASLEVRPLTSCPFDSAPALICDRHEVDEPEAMVELGTVPPGNYAIVASLPERGFYELIVELLSPTPPPTTDICTASTPVIRSSAALSGGFVTLADDYPAPSCGRHPGPAVDAVYALSLASAQDLTVTASGVGPAGDPRDVRYALVDDCTVPATSPRDCAASLGGVGEELRRWGLRAGDYWLVLEPDDSQPVSGYELEVDLTPPAGPVLGNRCADAVDITSGSASLPVARLRNTGGLGCGGSSAAYVDGFFTFHLGATRRVSIETTGPFHLLSLARDCDDPGTEIACRASTTTGGGTIVQRLPPGTYDVGVAIPSTLGTISASVQIGP
ncbi:MAG: putative metal-binding motif-containing protein [Sandaracinaceae bacterium]